MKQTIMTLLVAGFASAAAAAPNVAGDYLIQLYFGNSAAFQDEMHLEVDRAGTVTGMMHVPRDFDAPVENFHLLGNRFSFEVVVPRNASRPHDFRARYYGELYDDRCEQLAGFARILDSNEYMGSFLAFRKAAP